MKKTLRLLLLATSIFASNISHAKDNSQPPFLSLQPADFVFNEQKNIDFEIIYFFNLNCSSCIHFEKFFQSWFAKHKEFVSVKAIPSPVKPSWQLANNTYFATKFLNPSLSFFDIMNKQSKKPLLVHNYDTSYRFVHQFSDRSSDDIARALFSEETFKLVDYSKDLYNKFNVKGTPTIILISKKHNAYKISPEFANTYPKMLTVIDALISFNLR